MKGSPIYWEFLSTTISPYLPTLHLLSPDPHPVLTFFKILASTNLRQKEKTIFIIYKLLILSLFIYAALYRGDVFIFIGAVNIGFA